MLQYITNTKCGKPVTEQVKAVLEGGCRWIEVRMDGASDDEIEEVIKVIKPLCLDREAFLILSHNVELAKKLDVGGVHLSKGDMVSSKARTILGPAAVIGEDVSSFEDIKSMQGLDIDYFCISPFSGNGGDGIGLEGIRRICTQMLEEEIETAHVAEGDITIRDVDMLMEAGVNGLAVSDAIACADDIKEATEAFMKALAPFLK